jgi:hypothetical protein
MGTFPRTRAAAEQIRDHARSDIARARAMQLLDQLARCEPVLASGTRQPCPSTWGLLRALVLTVRDLTGRRWLEASSDDPAVCAFTALLHSVAPPGITDLDRVAAAVLTARFGPVSASGAAGTVSRVGTPGQHRPGYAPPDGTLHARDLRRAPPATAGRPEQSRPADHARRYPARVPQRPEHWSRAAHDHPGTPRSLMIMQAGPRRSPAGSAPGPGSVLFTSEIALGVAVGRHLGHLGCDVFFGATRHVGGSRVDRDVGRVALLPDARLAPLPGPQRTTICRRSQPWPRRGTNSRSRR